MQQAGSTSTTSARQIRETIGPLPALSSFARRMDSVHYRAPSRAAAQRVAREWLQQAPRHMVKALYMQSSQLRATSAQLLVPLGTSFVLTTGSSFDPWPFGYDSYGEWLLEVEDMALRRLKALHGAASASEERPAA